MAAAADSAATAPGDGAALTSGTAGRDAPPVGPARFILSRRRAAPDNPSHPAFGQPDEPARSRQRSMVHRILFDSGHRRRRPRQHRKCQCRRCGFHAISTHRLVDHPCGRLQPVNVLDRSTQASRSSPVANSLQRPSRRHSTNTVNSSLRWWPNSAAANPEDTLAQLNATTNLQSDTQHAIDLRNTVRNLRVDSATKAAIRNVDSCRGLGL